jgi:hypothetical protein
MSGPDEHESSGKADFGFRIADFRILCLFYFNPHSAIHIPQFQKPAGQPKKGSKAMPIHSLRTIIYPATRGPFCDNIPANLRPIKGVLS